MRATFILLEPMLARFGRVILPNPGGDRIGRRPVNYYVMAMEALGATIDYRNGYYFAARAGGGLTGAHIEFPEVTVMGTENAISPRPSQRDDRDRQRRARAGGRRPDRDAVRRWARIQRTAERRVEVEGVDVPRWRRASGPRRSAGGGDLRDRRRHHARDGDARGGRPAAPRLLPGGRRADGHLLRDRCGRAPASPRGWAARAPSTSGPIPIPGSRPTSRRRSRCS